MAVGSKLFSYSLTGASDYDGGWNSDAFHNSGILWNKTIPGWEAMPSGGSGGGGGEGTPQGANRTIQFNNSDSFDGDPELMWTTGDNLLSLSGQARINDTNMGVLTVTRRTTDGDSIYETMNMNHNCTNTPTAGLGVGNYFKLTDTAGNMDYTGCFGARWQVPTAGSERAQLVWHMAQNGSDPGGIASVKMIMDSNGHLGLGYCPKDDYVDYRLKVSGATYSHSLSSQTISGGTIDANAISSQNVSGSLIKATNLDIYGDIDLSSNSQNWRFEIDATDGNLVIKDNTMNLSPFTIDMSNGPVPTDTLYLISGAFEEADSGPGRVGINTSVPTEALHVVGGITSDWYSGSAIKESILTDKLDDNYFPSGIFTRKDNDIYYSGGKVIVANNIDFDMGNYNLQVSGNAFFSGNVQFIGELSGMADPTYNSGAANKHYVDNPDYVSSQGHISGSWVTPLYTKLPDANSHPGEIIRTSGNAFGTWVWISVRNVSPGDYEWIQLGMSTQ